MRQKTVMDLVMSCGNRRVLLLAAAVPLAIVTTSGQAVAYSLAATRAWSQDGPAVSPEEAAVRASSTAILNANSLAFTLTMQAEGASIAQYTPTLTADVKMMRDPANRNVWLVRATGSGKLTPAEKEAQFDVAWTSNAVEWVDHGEKKFYRRPGGAAKGKVMQLAGASKVREFVEASPLSKILKAASFVAAGKETIDGAECTVIDGMAKRAGTKDRIVIGPDSIPRRIEMILESDMLAGRVTANYRSMRVNEAMDPAELRITPPEGYESDIVEPGATPAPTTKPDTGTTEVPATAPTTEVVPAPVVKAGPEEAPQVQLPLGGDQKLDLASLKGNVVVLDFFGTWSLAARPAHAELKDLLPRYKDKPVKVYSLAVREKSADAASAYFAKQGLDWGSQGGVVPVGDAFVGPFKVKAFPTYVIINKDGMVVARLGNFKRGITMAHLAACVDAALDGKELPPEPQEAPTEPAAVPEVKVMAPDGSPVQAAGRANPSAKPTANGKQGVPDPRHTSVGTPTNTVPARTAPDSGAKKDQHKGELGKKDAAKK